MPKSTVSEIRARFDADVERFSNLETGQSATIDAPLVLDLIAAATKGVNPNATDMLDVGCGAGNYSLKLLQGIPAMNVTLIDLSAPMLARAKERVSAATEGMVTTKQIDIREADFAEASFDIITAAAVLHHLRGDDEWLAVFANFHHWLKPGGSVWISDLVFHDDPAVHAVMWARYGEYLQNLKDAAYRDHVFGYIEKEDTPRSLGYQTDLLRRVGFGAVEVLHKNSCFAAFGGIKR